MSKFDTIQIGDFVSIEKSFSQENVLYYLDHLSIDTNKIHYDKEFAKGTVFKECIVPGLLSASLFGGLLGSKLPGLGTIHLGQTCSFMKPIYIDEIVTAKIEVIKKRGDKKIIIFKTTIIKSNNEVALSGEAVVMMKE